MNGRCGRCFESALYSSITSQRNGLFVCWVSLRLSVHHVRDGALNPDVIGGCASGLCRLSGTARVTQKSEELPHCQLHAVLNPRLCSDCWHRRVWCGCLLRGMPPSQ